LGYAPENALADFLVKRKSRSPRSRKLSAILARRKRSSRMLWHCAIQFVHWPSDRKMQRSRCASEASEHRRDRTECDADSTKRPGKSRTSFSGSHRSAGFGFAAKYSLGRSTRLHEKFCRHAVCLSIGDIEDLIRARQIQRRQEQREVVDRRTGIVNRHGSY